MTKLTKATINSACIGILVVLGIGGYLFATGCAIRQTKPVSAASVVAKVSSTTVQQDTTVKTDVIAIEVKDANQKLILTESFEQPTIVVRGECPKTRVFLADGNSKKLKSQECLFWMSDAGMYYNGIRDNWIVTYLSGSVIGVYYHNNEWYVAASLQKLRSGLRRDYDNEAHTQ